MSYAQGFKSSWTKPIVRGRDDALAQFPIAFKLGPYKLAQASIDVTIIDVDDDVFSGRNPDLASYEDRSLFIPSLPDRIPSEPLGQNGRYLVYRLYRYDRSWVSIDGDFETYLTSFFSKVSRKNLRRRVKKLQEISGGDIDLRYYRTADDLALFYPVARKVSEKTFQERLMADGLPDHENFLRRLAELAHADLCLGSLIYLHGEPISFLYCEKRGSRWTAKYGGFDPSYSKLSPGTVHLLLILQELFDDDQCDIFDFGPGQCDYKEFFATDRQPCSDILILEKTTKNQMVTWLHQSLGLLTDCIIGIAEAIQLKELFRQRIRGR